MSKHINQARESLEKSKKQLVEAYLNTIRESYQKMGEKQRTQLSSSLEKFVEGVEVGKIPKVVVPEGKTYEFDGDTARKIREAVGLSLQELGEIVGIPKGTLSDWEKGHLPRHIKTSERGINYLKWIYEKGDYNPLELNFSK